VLGFPANDFAGQEPRSNHEIAVLRGQLRRDVPDVRQDGGDGRGREPAVSAAQRGGLVVGHRWLIDHGAKVYLPLGHSADIDLVADLGVSLSASRSRRRRSVAMAATK